MPFAEQIRRLEVHVPMSRYANHVQSVAGLFQHCTELQRLFEDNAQYRDQPLWQRDRFPNLVRLKIVVIVEECFGVQLRRVMRDLPQNARVLLHPKFPAEVVVQGLQASCDGTCGPLLEGVVGGMVRTRP